MARAKKEETVAPTREALENLYKEMEEVFQPDVPFKKISKKTTDADLIELIKKEAVDEDGNSTIYTTDMEEDPENPDKVIFSEEAEDTIKLLGIEIVEPEEEGGEEKAEPAKEEAPAKEEKKAAKNDAKPAKNAKKEEAKAPVKEEKGKAAKSAPAAKEDKKAAKEAPKGKAKADKPATGNSYTRSIALVDALKDTLTNGPATKKEICDLSDELYVEQGGKSGAFVAEVMFRYTVPALIALGIVEKGDGGTFKLVE